MKHGLVTLLVVAGLAAEVRAQGKQCQDRRADNVEVHFTSAGFVDQCRDYWVFFGLRIVQNVTPCPSTVSLHPAHQECGQTPNPDTNCVFEGNVDIQTRNCACVADGSPMFGSINEDCECDQFLPSGSLEDFQTVDCIVVTPPRS